MRICSDPKGRMFIATGKQYFSRLEESNVQLATLRVEESVLHLFYKPATLRVGL